MDKQSAPQLAIPLLMVLLVSTVASFVYVEATPAQVEGTLAELSRRRDAFVSVTVVPSPTVATQQSFCRFNRAGPETQPAFGA